MISLSALKDAKQIGIWGLGKEGQASLQFIAKHHPQVQITVLNDHTIDRSTLPANIQSLLSQVPVLEGLQSQDCIASGQLPWIVKSPGISLYRPEIELSRSQGTQFTSATNLALEWITQLCQDRKKTKPCIVAVTGSKGKSTTASLIHHLLQILDCPAELAGNIGTPLFNLEFLQNTAYRIPDVLVLELSSYQIADLQHAPDCAVLTNLFDAHSQWHNNSVQQYHRDKLRLIELQADGPVIANAGNATLQEQVLDRKLKQPSLRIHWFNHSADLEQDNTYVSQSCLYHVHQSQLYRNTQALSFQWSLKGEHNLSNLAAALSVVHVLGLDDIKAQQGLAGFQGLPHRLQTVGHFRKRLCVNDSIATLPEASVEALKAYENDSVLLLWGGQYQEASHTPHNLKIVLEQIQDSTVKHLFLLPHTGPLLQKLIAEQNLNIPHTLCSDLAQAVELAFALSAENDVLLLSPGAPSYNQFRNFEHRGQVFCALCHKQNSSLVTPDTEAFQ